MTYLKPQSPLCKNENYFYPLTTADQVIMEDNTRLNAALENKISINALGATNGVATLDSNGKVIANQMASAVKNISADSYTLTSDDAGKFLRCTGANAKVITIPTDTSNSIFPIGTELEITLASSASELTVQLENTTDDLFLWSNNSGTSFTSTGKWPLVTLKKVTTGRWIVRGDIA